MEKLNKITILTLLGLTTAPVVLNNIETHLNSHYVLSQIAHANTPATDIDSLTETAHTPVYHLETAQGWSNDLQTINWNEKGGYYDIYFLHSVDGATNPFGPNGQNWTHCTTKDFVHFSEQNSAIPSNVKNSMSSNDQAWKSAWTGSVVQNQGNISGVPKGDYVAYFSGLKKADGSQNIWAAWSDDNGRTFSHVLNNGNPVLPYNAPFASNDKDNERDAYVCYWNGKMLMYCAEGDKLGVYQSKDGINWSKADPAGASKVLASTFMKGVNWTDANKPVECPCLKMMTTPDGQTKAVLFYGGKTPQDGQTTGTYYVVGHLDQNGLFAAETNAKRLDLGSDYYGSNFSGTDDLNKPNASIDTMGWVGNWSYTSQGVHNSQDGTGPYTGRLGSYTLPRKLTLNNDLTLSSNIDDSNLHLTKTNDFNNVTKDKPATKDGKLNILGQDADYGPIYTLADIPDVAANGEYDLHFTNTDGYKGRIYIHIWQGADYVKLNFDPTNNNFRVAGKATELNDDLSGTAASSAYYDGMLGNGNGYAEHLDNAPNSPKDFHLKIFTDKDSVEFQFPNGQTYTVARYAINDNQDFKVYSQDPTGKNTMTLAVNTVDTLPKSTTNTDNNKPATNTGTTANTATTKPNTNTATTKPNDSKPATNTGTTNTTENKPATGTTTTTNNKPAAGNTENKPTTTQPTTNNTNTTYKYSVAYFNNDTGQSMKTAEFTSPDKLSDSDLSSKINSNAPGKVIKYNVDETKKNDDGSTSVDIIALVDTSSSNTTTNKPATDNKPATNTGNTANTNTTKPTTNTATENTTKPATTNTEKPSDNKSSSSSAAKDDKPATNTATTKPSDNKSSSSNTAKNDKPATNTEKPSDSKSSSSSAKDDKPATGNSNKADTNTTKPATNTDNKSDSNKSSSSTDKADSGKVSTAKPTDNSNKSDNKSDSNTAKPNDSKPATGTETKPDGNKADTNTAKNNNNKSSAGNTNKADTNTVKSSADKTSANSDKADSNKANSTENKSDAKSDNKQSAGTTTDKNGVKSSSMKNINVTGAKSATSSLSESSKKSSMKSEINSGKSSSSSVSSKHNGETEISSVKSSSSSINNSENESSLTSSVKSSSMNDNAKKADNISGKLNDVADTKSGKVSQSSSSIAGTQNAINNNSNNNNTLFSNQNASGNNTITPEASTTTSTSPSDDTYSAQKAEMLAKTNARAKQGGIIAAIGAVIATIAGWFGLKKKN